ncbi:hypothetical protein ACIRP0_31920 [Streptomyces sp. NPDC101733]|uniref:hypothetical protein n=1 Tax=unclassified Streptomyces TaxID=2593676 RepID=UPI00381762F7
MKLTKQFTAISVAATAAVLFSAGAAQAQGDGEFLSFLGNTPLQRISYTVQLGDGNSYTGTQNTNTNNNSGKGTANNNNNNNGGLSQAEAGIPSTLGNSALQEISYPVQVGSGNTFIGTQNINTNNNTGSGTYNNNNNNNNGGVNNNNNNNNNGGTNNNNNNNNNGGGGTNNNNNNNNGSSAHPHATRTLWSGKLAPSVNEAAAATNRQACLSSMGHVGQDSAVISGALKIHCAQR